MTPADFLTWLRHSLASHPFPPPQPPSWVVIVIQVSLPCHWRSAAGELRGHTAGSCGHPLVLPVGKEAKKCQRRPGVATLRAKHSWRTHYRGKTHGEAPKEFILEASGQPTGGGCDWSTAAMQHPWERVSGAKPLLQNGPCPGSAETQSCSIRKARGWDRYCLPSFETSQKRSVRERNKCDVTTAQWQKGSIRGWAGQGISYTQSVPCGLFKAPGPPTCSLKGV